MPIEQGKPIHILVLKGEKGAGALFAEIAGDPKDNEALADVLSTKLEAGDLNNVPHKQDIKNLTNDTNMGAKAMFELLGIDIIKLIVDICYPLGIIIKFGIDFNPNKVSPFNQYGMKWNRWAQGKYSVGQTSNGAPQYNVPGTIVGNPTIKLPAHRHQIHIYNRNPNEAGGWLVTPTNFVSLLHRNIVIKNGALAEEEGTNVLIGIILDAVSDDAPSVPGELWQKFIVGDQDAALDGELVIQNQPEAAVESMWVRVK